MSTNMMVKDLEGSATSSTHDNAASSKASSPPLSRNELYTPLIAFQQDKVEPSLYMTRRKVPKSLQDSTLSKFLETVSTHYHRSSKVDVKDARNNGSRPLLAHEMDERLRQRAVTLVGDGMFAGNRNKRKRQSMQQQLSTVSAFNKNLISNRKRKKQIKLAQSKQTPILPSSGTTSSKSPIDIPIDCIESGQDDTQTNTSNHDLKVLTKLNSLWNDYIRQLVNLRQPNEEEELFVKVSDVIGMGAELVGALVRVKQCPPQSHLAGMEGFLVATTVHTWKISKTVVVVRPKQKVVQPNMQLDAEWAAAINSPVEQQQQPEQQLVVMVPKRGSILTIRLPLHQLKQSIETEDRAPPKFLCVDIKG